MTEIAIKTSIGKLNIPEDRLLRILEDLLVTLMPHTPRHARRLYGLPLHHREPFDRMLIATALAEDMPVLTSDREFLRYQDAGLKIISC